jgi:hypothetical protein
VEHVHEMFFVHLPTTDVQGRPNQIPYHFVESTVESNVDSIILIQQRQTRIVAFVSTMIIVIAIIMAVGSFGDQLDALNGSDRVPGDPRLALLLFQRSRKADKVVPSLVQFEYPFQSLRIDLVSPFVLPSMVPF